MIAQLAFKVERTQGLRSLSGWKKSYRIPEDHSVISDEFAFRCAAEDLKQDLDRMYDQLKESFGFTRRKLNVIGPEDGFVTITTPYFNYTVSVQHCPDELDAVLWTKRVDTIQEPEQLESAAFAEIFDNMFTTLEVSLPVRVDIENFIDRVEEAAHPGIKISYNREATYCQLLFSGTTAAVTLTAENLAIVHKRRVKTSQLIKSMDLAQKILGQHDVSLVSVTPAKTKRPRQA